MVRLDWNNTGVLNVGYNGAGTMIVTHGCHISGGTDSNIALVLMVWFTFPTLDRLDHSGCP